jgi:hypothetical protein
VPELESPKSVAASILGPIAGPGVGDDEPAEDEEDAESVALGAAADEMLDAFERKDRAGLVSALRSLLALR